MKELFNAVVAGKHYKKFGKAHNCSMNSVWDRFNRYAKSRGFKTLVEGPQYLGGMAWSNGSEIMELV